MCFFKRPKKCSETYPSIFEMKFPKTSRKWINNVLILRNSNRFHIIMYFASFLVSVGVSVDMGVGCMYACIVYVHMYVYMHVCMCI